MSKPNKVYSMPYSPLRLKRRLSDSGLSQASLMKALNEKGYECSRPLINLVVNKGYIPDRAPEEFRNLVEEVLKGKGLSADSIWETEPDERRPAKNRAPRKLRNIPLPGEGTGTERKTTGEEAKKMNYTKEYLEPEEIVHFGLEDDPFFDLDDHKDIWMSAQLKVAERQVWRTIKSRGIIAITGNYGMGKSTFLRHIISKLLGDKTVRIIMPDRLDRDMMTGGLLTEEIISQLGGTKMPRSAGQRDKVAKKLLEDNMKSGVYTVLAIDEAHDLKEKIFISLKRLWDSGMIFKLIAIVLIGAGGRDDAGKNWGLRGMIEGNPYIKEFAERCYMVDLGKLNGNMSDYLDYRFHKAGRRASEIFTSDALAHLAQRAKTPQIANNIAVRAMKIAYQDGKTTVHFDHVNDA